MTLPWFKFFRIDTTSPMLFALEEKVGEAALAHLAKLCAALPDECLDGDLSGVTDHAIERWAQWRGAAGELVRALRATGWITPDGQLWKWQERQASTVAKFVRDAARPSGRSRPARDNARTPRGTSSEPRAGHHLNPARGASASARGVGDADTWPARDDDATPRGTSAGPARGLLILNSSDPDQNLERERPRAGQPTDPARAAERAEAIGAIAAQLASELGEPLPPVDVDSLEFVRWTNDHPSIFNEARRAVDGGEEVA